MIPTNLLFNNKKASAYANSYTSAIQPSGGLGDYKPGSSISINIPCSANTVLCPSESVLKFSLTVKATATDCNYARLDRAGAHGFIQRIRIYHGSNLLEDIDSYNNLVALMFSLQSSGDAAKGKQNILSGVNSESVFPISGAVMADVAAINGRINGSTNVVSTINTGERLNSYATGAILGAATTVKRTYCINLLSLLGSLGNDKYIPLFAMTSSSLRCEIQLVADPGKFICSSVALETFTIADVEYIGQFITLGTEAMDIINRSTNGGAIEWVVPSYRNYVASGKLENSSTPLTLNAPAKFSSLKSLFLTMRGNSPGAPTFFPFGSNHYKMAQYSLRVGSKTLPSGKPVTTITESFVELLKAINSVSNLDHEPNINWADYNASVPIANVETATRCDLTSSSPSFAIGIDMETYAGSSKESIFSGLNTSTDDIFWNITFNANSTTPNVIFDTYALFDQVISCREGVAYPTY